MSNQPALQETPAPGLGSWILRRLSRVTTSNRFISQIDGLRFFAIFTVICLHINSAARKQLPPEITADAASTPVSQFTWWGGIGVDFFFAISGFILAFPFALHHLSGAKPVRLKDYFIRRVTRLEPPYILALLMMFAALLVVPPAGLKEPVTLANWPNLLASIFYVHNIAYGEPSLINGVAWSLEIEVQFYILAPLLAYVFAFQSPLVRRGIMVAVIVAFGVLKGGFDDDLERYRLHLSLLGAMHRFFVGFLMADIFITTWKQAPTHGRKSWDLLGLLGMVLLFPAAAKPDDPIFGSWLTAYPKLPALLHPLSSLGIGLVFAAAFRGWAFHAFFTNIWIATIGGMCYTIYLFHYPIAFAAMKLTRRFTVGENYDVNLLVQIALLFPIILVLCSIFFVIIERPCMHKDWPQRLWAWIRRRPIPTKAAHG
jgi:peptidoglycan/LPS O-acetylase OafA/YrhL